jgi:hypothetical protein
MGWFPTEAGIGRHYTIAGSHQTATGRDIVITLKDVRQIQLAKGALYTGIEFLMRKAGIEKIDRTILTGAFGARFNWKNALAIGMLPPAVAQGAVMPKDNLAGVGVVMALLDKKLRVGSTHPVPTHPLPGTGIRTRFCHGLCQGHGVSTDSRADKKLKISRNSGTAAVFNRPRPYT